MASNIAPHANFGMMNGPIPGEGLTNAPGSMPCMNPPQHVHLDELLEMVWQKINNPQVGIQIYGLLKAGLPAEAIARTLCFGMVQHGVALPSLSLLSVRTVVRQIVALGHFLGLKNIKIRNPNPVQAKTLAMIAQAIDANNGGDGPSAGDQIQANTGLPIDPSPTPSSSASSNIFSGLGS